MSSRAWQNQELSQGVKVERFLTACTASTNMMQYLFSALGLEPSEENICISKLARYDKRSYTVTDRNNKQVYHRKMDWEYKPMRRIWQVFRNTLIWMRVGMPKEVISSYAEPFQTNIPSEVEVNISLFDAEGQDKYSYRFARKSSGERGITIYDNSTLDELGDFTQYIYSDGDNSWIRKVPITGGEDDWDIEYSTTEINLLDLPSKCLALHQALLDYRY